MMSDYKFVPCTFFQERSAAEMKQRSRAFMEELARRRSVRDFSRRPVEKEVVQNCVQTASFAPSGANMQPWHFVVIGAAETKRRIRQAAEKEEQEFYSRRAPEEWLDALAPLGTNPDKPLLVDAPYLIAVFAQRYGTTKAGERVRHYYVSESVGIAVGFLLAAIHHAGLVAAIHTPMQMGFLNDILDVPQNERAYLLLAVGYPAPDAKVPDIQKKALNEVCTFIE
jgi:nitroreductase